MKLSSYLNKEFIFTDLQGDNKSEVISNLVEKVLEKDEKLKNRNVVKAILDRERKISTALGKSFAIPHVRIEGYNDFIFAVGKTKAKVECQTVLKSTDKINLFFLIIAPQLKNKLMLQVMSGVSKLSSKHNIFEKIIDSNSKEEICELIESANIVISENLTAMDLVVKEIMPVRLEDTLEVVLNRLVEEGIQGLPVVDENEKFVGEITEKELIKCGMPKYISFMDDLNFMTISEPFEEFFKKEKTMKVKETFRKNPQIIKKDTPILQIASLIINKNITRLYVVENEKFIGVVLRSDLITKILGA